MTHSNSGYSGSVLRLYVFSSTFCCIQVLYFFDQTPQLLFISLLVLCGYYSRAAFISLESPETSTMGWIRYVRWWWLLDAVSSTCSLSLLLSAVGTTRTTQTVLALAWWPSSEIIRTRVRMPHLLAAATIRGWRLFRSRASDCAATIWGQWLFEGGVYSKKYSNYKCLVYKSG